MYYKIRDKYIHTYTYRMRIQFFGWKIYCCQSYSNWNLPHY